MVEHRVTDPRRIAQLFASAVTGRARGALADYTVADASPDAAPDPRGTPAFRVRPAAGAAEDEERETPSPASEGPVGHVSLYPDHARLALQRGAGAADSADDRPSVDAGGRDDLVVLTDPAGAADLAIEVRSGAAVKPAIDRLEAVLRRDASGGFRLDDDHS